MTNIDLNPEDHPGANLHHFLSKAGLDTDDANTLIAKHASMVSRLNGATSTPAADVAELQAELDKLIRWHKEDGDQAAKMRATSARLRAERTELIRQRDQIAMDTIKAMPAPADPAAVLREAADAVDATDFPDDFIDAFDNGATWATAQFRRLADEAQQPGAAEELTATLVIGRSDSHCGGCGKSTLPRNTHHHDISGWTPRPGEGCGARFVAMRSDSRSVTADILKDIRPDLPIEPLPATEESTP